MPLLELLNYSVSVPLQTTSTETIFKGEKKKHRNGFRKGLLRKFSLIGVWEGHKPRHWVPFEGMQWAPNNHIETDAKNKVKDWETDGGKRREKGRERNDCC